MGFFPDVNAGDPFIPNAGLSNAVRHIVNTLNGFQSDAIPAKNMSIIRVVVYNASMVSFAAGQAVSLDLDGAIIHDAYPAVAYDEDLPCYGVCISGATPGGISDCVLTGIAKVIISGGTATSYAKPVSDGTFETSDDEGFRIINISGGTSAVILMGDYVKAGGGGGSYGIAANVTGGTASVSLVPGGTSSSFGIVPGTPNVHISGGSNGELIVGVTGGTGTFLPPIYGPGGFIGMNTWYSFPTGNGWVIGMAQAYQSDYQYPLQAQIFTIDESEGQMIDIIWPLPNNSTFDNFKSIVPFCFPILYGYKIRFDGDPDAFYLDANIYDHY